jgi:hypothetical protein
LLCSPRTFVYHRPHRFAAHATSLILSPKDHHPDRVLIVDTHGLLLIHRFASSCALLHSAGHHRTSLRVLLRVGHMSVRHSRRPRGYTQGPSSLFFISRTRRRRGNELLPQFTSSLEEGSPPKPTQLRSYAGGPGPELSAISRTSAKPSSRKPRFVDSDF